MADIRILMGCIAVLAIGTFICTLVANAAPSNIPYSPLQNVNTIVNFNNVSRNQIGLTDIWGTWNINEDVGYIYPTSFDYFHNNYAVCEFGHKDCINGVISEKITVDGLIFNSTSDVWGISVFNTQFAELAIEFRAGRCYITEKPCDALFTYNEFDTGWAISSCPVNVSYTYYNDNKTLLVYLQYPSNEYQIYNGVVDILQDCNLLVGMTSNTISDTYQQFNDLLNGTSKSRVGCNFNSFKIVGYTMNTISIDSVSYSYSLNTNPLDFGVDLLGMLVYQVPVVNNEPILPIWVWFFAIGLWEIGIIAWIVMAVIEAIPF